MTGQVIEFPGRVEPWVGVERLAEHFGVSPQTIYRWAKMGMPSGKGAGSRGALRFKISECEGWLRRDG